MLKLFLPRLGQTMEEALLEGWIVQPGVSFSVGDPLYEVETEKVTVRVDATIAGSVARAMVRDGDQLEVGALLAVIAEPGEQPTGAEIDAFLTGVARTADISPSEAAHSEALASLEVAPVRSDEPVRAMPKARALARDLGIDIGSIAARSPGQLVTEEQVRVAATPAPATPTPLSIPAPLVAVASVVATPLPLVTARQPAGGIDVRERRRLSGIARRMAEVTARTWSTVPQFSQSIDVSALNWAERRDRLRAQTAIDVGYTDLILNAMVRAVQEVPEANSSYTEETLTIYRDVNISIAVDSPEGLQVPVLHRMQDLSEAGRARLLRERTAKAREGALTLDDVQGGTITMSNLGRFGIEGGMPMVTAPQATVVFVGAIVPRVVPVEAGIGVRPVCTIVTAFDHRAVDGATAARFTAALRRLLQEGTS
jgi:pyruvate dehydrogenase E2 component (dihydrolipoamide acetyltransferase)